MNKFVATLHWIVGSDCDQQLLRFFLRERCHLSRRALADIKYNGGLITVNEKEVTVRSIVRKGDRVTVSLPEEVVSEAVIAEQIAIEIIYEDDHLLVINKQSGMPTIPSREHPNHTLANAVIGYYDHKGIPATFHAVNRLDRDTSGLLIVAKHRFAHDRLSKLQQAGKVKRYYKAIVEGHLDQKVGTIDAPIGRDPSSIIARQVCADGQRAVTHYSVQSVIGDKSLVEIQLETGRTHQIRVHFSYVGHPLVGDDLYNGKQDRISRQALHCFRVDFEHPFDETIKVFKQDLPDDMKCLIK